MVQVEEKKGLTVPVPGFGFFSPQAAAAAEQLFQQYLDQTNLDISNLTLSDLDQIKCQETILPSWTRLFPHMADLPSEAVCPPTWDGASCLPPTLAGHTAVIPCMSFYDGVFYSSECESMTKRQKVQDHPSLHRQL